MHATANDTGDAETPLYATRLMPHRSWSRAQARLFVAVFAALCAAATVPFWLLGAWPVIGFFGLDAALVALAFRASFHSARACEEVRVTPLELHLAKISARGARRDWRFNPLWVRLEREDHAEFGLQRLAVASRGRRVALAVFLGADEKARFADELAAALARARRGARFS